MKTKYTRQELFDKAWTYYVREGRSYNIQINTNNTVTPVFANGETYLASTQANMAIQYNQLQPSFYEHIDIGFFAKLQSCHDKAVKYVFSNANKELIRNFYARKFQRQFRRLVKFFMIDFAMKYDLTIPTERATTPTSRAIATRNKR